MDKEQQPSGSGDKPSLFDRVRAFLETMSTVGAAAAALVGLFVGGGAATVYYKLAKDQPQAVVVDEVVASEGEVIPKPPAQNPPTRPEPATSPPAEREPPDQHLTVTLEREEGETIPKLVNRAFDCQEDLHAAQNQLQAAQDDAARLTAQLEDENRPTWKTRYDQRGETIQTLRRTNGTLGAKTSSLEDQLGSCNDDVAVLALNFHPHPLDAAPVACASGTVKLVATNKEAPNRCQARERGPKGVPRIQFMQGGYVQEILPIPDAIWPAEYGNKMCTCKAALKFGEEIEWFTDVESPADKADETADAAL